ncbi:MAG: hypothetical protein RL447_236 [Bacteroidota bacterium]|jgi:hypothetical protein
MHFICQMKRSTLIALLFGLLTAIACFLPWMSIESKDLLITGMDTTGTKFGKPGLLHLILAGIYTIFTLVPKAWGQRANLLVIAVNAAWCLRNFLLLSACSGGECPVRLYGFYLLLISSIGMMVATLFTKKEEGRK